MTTRKLKCCLAAAGLIAAALAGCHDDDHPSSTAPPATAKSTDFVFFTTQLFSNSENSMPINLDGINFDLSNEDPTAFDPLLMM
jgi:hypothetical protein